MAPDTVTEAVAFLTAEGYVDELRLRPDGLEHPERADLHPFATACVDHTFRFEGPTDPADEAIVLGVSCVEWGRRGIVVAAYGPSADPEETDALLALVRAPRA